MKGQRISFSGQVRNYQNTVSQVVNLLGGETQAADYLKRCIYSVGLGSNDYLNNYFMPTFYSSSRQFTPEQFANDLITRYSTQLNVRFPYGYLYHLCFYVIRSPRLVQHKATSFGWFSLSLELTHLVTIRVLGVGLVGIYKKFQSLVEVEVSDQ